MLDGWFWAWGNITHSQTQLWTRHLMTGGIEKAAEMEGVDEIEISRSAMLRKKAAWLSRSTLASSPTQSPFWLLCSDFFHYYSSL